MEYEEEVYEDDDDVLSMSSDDDEATQTWLSISEFNCFFSHKILEFIHEKEKLN